MKQPAGLLSVARWSKPTEGEHPFPTQSPLAGGVAAESEADDMRDGFEGRFLATGNPPAAGRVKVRCSGTEEAAILLVSSLGDRRGRAPMG